MTWVEKRQRPGRNPGVEIQQQLVIFAAGCPIGYPMPSGRCETADGRQTRVRSQSLVRVAPLTVG